MILPLVILDAGLGELDFSDVRMVTPNEVPEPYKILLVHSHHMTVTVEGFYREAVDVQVLANKSVGNYYQRKILLTLQKSKKVVQFGLVRIDLSCCAEPVKEAILEQKIPLGRVLIEHNVLRRVEPTAFVKVQPKPAMMGWFGLSEAERLYGRTGVIFCDDRPAISVLEILAPVAVE